MTTEIDKLAWLHVVDRQVLFARSKGRQACYIPGGKREPGESDEVALVREIREELSVDLLPETIRLAGTFRAQADGKPDGALVKMSCYQADYRGRITAAAEIEEVLWLRHRDKDRCSAVGRLILDWLQQQGMID